MAIQFNRNRVTDSITNNNQQQWLNRNIPLRLNRLNRLNGVQLSRLLLEMEDMERNQRPLQNETEREHQMGRILERERRRQRRRFNYHRFRFRPHFSRSFTRTHISSRSNISATSHRSQHSNETSREREIRRIVEYENRRFRARLDRIFNRFNTNVHIPRLQPTNEINR